MVLTKAELVTALQNEVRILQHLMSKVDRGMLDYRPTPKQRSTIELLQYLTIMGPGLIRAGLAGAFDQAAWTAAEEASRRLGFDDARGAIAAQVDTYARLLAGVADADLRQTVDMFGDRMSRGAMLVTMMLSGCAAYRTQLCSYFCTSRPAAAGS